MNTKQTIIEEIKENLEWNDIDDSTWLNELKVVDLKKILHYSINWKHHDQIKNAASLMKMFTWAETAEGHSYWANIYNKLKP